MMGYELILTFILGTLFGLAAAVVTFIASVRVVGNLHGIGTSLLTGRSGTSDPRPLPFVVKNEAKEFEIESANMLEPIPDSIGR